MHKMKATIGTGNAWEERGGGSLAAESVDPYTYGLVWRKAHHLFFR